MRNWKEICIYAFAVLTAISVVACSNIHGTDKSDSFSKSAATTQQSSKDYSKKSGESGGGTVNGQQIVFTTDKDGNTIVTYLKSTATSQPSSYFEIHDQRDSKSTSEADQASIDSTFGATYDGISRDYVKVDGFMSKTLGTDWKVKVPICAICILLGVGFLAAPIPIKNITLGIGLIGIGIAAAILPVWLIGLVFVAAVVIAVLPYINKSKMFGSVVAGIERGKAKVSKLYVEAASTGTAPSLAAVKSALNDQLEAEQTTASSDYVDKVRATPKVVKAVDQIKKG